MLTYLHTNDTINPTKLSGTLFCTQWLSQCGQGGSQKESFHTSFAAVLNLIMLDSRSQSSLWSSSNFLSQTFDRSLVSSLWNSAQLNRVGAHDKRPCCPHCNSPLQLNYSEVHITRQILDSAAAAAEISLGRWQPNFAAKWYPYDQQQSGNLCWGLTTDLHMHITWKEALKQAGKSGPNKKAQTSFPSINLIYEKAFAAWINIFPTSRNLSPTFQSWGLILPRW